MISNCFLSFCSRFFGHMGPGIKLHQGFKRSPWRPLLGPLGTVGPQRAFFSALASQSPEISAGTRHGRMGRETSNHSAPPFWARTPRLF